MNGFLVWGGVLVALASLFVVPTFWRVQAPASPSKTGLASESPSARMTGLVLLAALVLSTGLIYGHVGDPRGLAAQQTEPPASPQAMVKQLADRLEQQPDDPEGWKMLARSYETLRQFDKAVAAYERLMSLKGRDADVLTDYAVALGMARGGSLIGDPEKVLHEALKLNPRHVQALALSGGAALERQDYKQAVAQWRALLAVIPEDEQVRASIEENLREAEALAAQSVTQPARSK